MKNQARFRRICGVFFFVSIPVAVSACQIKMTAEERIGETETCMQIEDSSIQAEISVHTESLTSSSILTEGLSEISTGTFDKERTEIPLIHVKYEPYNLYELAKILLDMDSVQVDRMKTDDTSLYLGTLAEGEDPYSIYYKKGISLFDGNSNIEAYMEDDAASYSDMLSDGSGGSWYPYQASKMVYNFSAEEWTDVTLEEAESEIQIILEQIGFQIGEWNGCVADVDFISRYREEQKKLSERFDDTLYEYVCPEKKDEVYLYVFRQLVQGVLLEDVNGESLIHVVYSPSKREILSIRTVIPVLGDCISEEQRTLISREEAESYANEILKMPTQISSKLYEEKIFMNSKATKLELVYIRQSVGGIDYENQTVSLYPAWKASYQVMVEGKTVEDYILLNAETGLQYTNASQLY